MAKNVNVYPEFVEAVVHELAAGQPVALPGIGTLRTESIPATINRDPDQVRVSPPSTRIVFEQDDQSTDGGS